MQVRSYQVWDLWQEAESAKVNRKCIFSGPNANQNKTLKEGFHQKANALKRHLDGKLHITKTGVEQNCFALFSGQVALIIGGTSPNGPTVELFSPDGKCQHQLADIPTRGTYLYGPALAYIENKIFSCGGRGYGITTVSLFWSQVLCSNFFITCALSMFFRSWWLRLELS